MAASRVAAIERLAAVRPGVDREHLAALIMCGEVCFDDETVREPRARVGRNARVTFRPRQPVSRGGRKLEHALSVWRLDVSGKVLVDVGASTGGFTQVLLWQGATGVHAVDVGYNQLDYGLRVDPRVYVHERTNILDITALEPPPAAAVADLSFRSLCGAARHVLELTTEQWAVLLLKPQFEWRKPSPEFDGTVPDADAPGVVLDTVLRLADEGVYTHECTESPIRGRSGNREFLLLVRLERSPAGTREVLRRALGDDPQSS